MRRLKRSGLIVLVLAGLLIGSGVAWAQEEAPEDQTEQAGDTLFSFGYVILHHFFGWNLTPIGGLTTCNFDAPVVITFGVPEEDGSIPGDTGTEGCDVTGGDVTGPAGQVNHGMFMKLFNSLYEGTGRGCVARFIAHSDLGKGEQQVGPEGDPNYQPIVGGEVTLAAFESVEADCEHGKKNDSEPDDEVVEAELQGNGRPDHAGKPEHAGKPDGGGKPDHAGKPDNPGNGNGHGNDE